MTNFRNLKIAINDKQPLDEVVRELERLWYAKYSCPNVKPIEFIEVYKDAFRSSSYYNSIELRETTLVELKEM